MKPTPASCSPHPGRRAHCLRVRLTATALHADADGNVTGKTTTRSSWRPDPDPESLNGAACGGHAARARRPAPGHRDGAVPLRCEVTGHSVLWAESPSRRGCHVHLAVTRTW